MKGLILFLSFCLGTIAWHTTGHFAVAYIAEKELREKNPKLLAKLVELLDVLKAFTKEKEHSFVESACFVDDIKAQSWKAFNAFHFYDLYTRGPNITPADLEKLPKSSVNIATTLAECRQTLRNTRETQIDDRLGKSLMLRFLIHLVGDVHQPLHAASRVTQDRTKGDSGGNAFKLSKPKSDLHTQWDHTLGIFTALKAPLEAKHWGYLGEMTKGITEEYTRDVLKEDLKIDKVNAWIKKGKDLTRNCYFGIEENGEVSEKYKKVAEPIIRRQLALGGYRLADMLIDTFKEGDLESYFAIHQKKGYVDDDTEDDRGRANSSDSSDSEDDDAPVAKTTKPNTPAKGTTSSKPATSKPNILKPIKPKKSPATDKAATKDKAVAKDKNAAKDKTAAKKGGLKVNKKGYESDNGAYEPSADDEMESEYDQNSAVEENEDGSAPEEEPRGYFSSFFGAIGNFFNGLFGG
jgi:hypothetical protein